MTLFRFRRLVFFFREHKTHKLTFRTHVSVFLYFFEFNVLYNPRKTMLLLCWSLSAGDFSRELYVKA